MSHDVALQADAEDAAEDRERFEGEVPTPSW
jgi:hypothetical protein